MNYSDYKYITEAIDHMVKNKHKCYDENMTLENVLNPLWTYNRGYTKGLSHLLKLVKQKYELDNIEIEYDTGNEFVDIGIKIGDMINTIDCGFNNNQQYKIYDIIIHDAKTCLILTDEGNTKYGFGQLLFDRRDNKLIFYVRAIVWNDDLEQLIEHCNRTTAIKNKNLGLDDEKSN